MADQKISELNALTGVNAADDDALAIVDTSATETKKITRAQLFTDTPSIDVSGNITVSGTVDGRDVATDGTKLDGIEASADVTDATNVTAAGALMDSEVTNLAQVKAFDSSDYATAAQGSTADAALARSGGTMTGAITFAAGQAFSGDGSNLTNVAAASIEVSESADDNVTYNILFSDTDGSGNVQMTPTQDDGGLTYNPALDTLTTYKIQVADSIVHRDDTNTYIDFGSDEIRLVAGGVEFIKLVEGTDDYVRFAQRIYLASDQNIKFEGSTADDFETTLYVVDPTADRTITLPDATGTVALDDVATTSDNGLMSSSDKTKLDGIEASADVTDTTNVTAAGALMDSEVTNLAQVKAFDSSDYATAAQGTTADNALPKSGGAMTGAITTNSTFDGRDVSADGSKLDGIESGATADQTAAEILTAIKTVDGSGSGLDADLLDGQSGSYYQNASNINAGTLDNARLTDIFKSGSEIAGSQDLNNYRTTGYYSQDSNADATSGSNYPVDLAGILEVITGDQGNGLQTEQRYSRYNTNEKYVRHYYNGTWTAWAEVWNSSNDGSGSGLDADTVDGIEASQFLRSDVSDSSTGTLTLDIVQVGNELRLPNNTSLTDVSLTGTSDQDTGFNWSGSNAVNYVSGGTLKYNLNDVWASTNDGSGSGLDADTVDGIEASSFLRSDADDSTSSTITFSNDIVVGDQIIHDGDTDTYMQFDAADSWRVVAGGGEKLSTATNGITITSASGYATFGSSNSSWFHMSTDRPNFYMAQGLRVNGTLGVYNQNTYLTSDDIYLNGILYHYGDTDTYMQFHNANQWRVVTGGTERLEVTDSNVTVNTGLKLNKEVTENVTALSGTSDVLEPQEGTIRTHTLSGNTTYTESFLGGQSMTLMIDDGAGYTVTWPTMTWVNNGGSAPTLATSGYTVIVLWKALTGGTLYGALVGDGS